MNRLADKMDSEDCRLFERMQGAAQRMGNLIDELLTYSQVTRGISHMEDVDLNRKVRLVLEDLELELQEKQACITMDILPQVKGNKRQMQQLFFNLIGNALKYSKTDIPPEIHLSYRLAKAEELKEHLHAASSSTPYHLIEVRDNGIGFEPKDAERIFQVFTRLYGNAEYSGTGIGLSIVRKVAVNHGGWVWAESKPGEGASFTVALPVA